MVQQFWRCFGSARMQVQCQAWDSGLRLWHCCSCSLVCNCSSDLITGLATPYATGLPKKKKKKPAPVRVNWSPQEFTCEENLQACSWKNQEQPVAVPGLPGCSHSAWQQASGLGLGLSTSIPTDQSFILPTLRLWNAFSF